MPWQVLLVGEDATIGSGLSRADADIQVTVAPDVVDALILMHSQRFDAAICDCNGSTSDELAFIRAARGETATANLPILALVSDTLDEGSRQELLEAGADDWASKPMRPEKMIAALAAAIARRPAHQLAKDMTEALETRSVRRPRRAHKDADISELRLAAVKEQAVKALMDAARLQRQLDQAAAEQTQSIEDASERERVLRRRIADLEDQLQRQRETEDELRLEVDKTLDLRESARRLYNGVLDRARDRYRAPN